ncbi:MAG: gfo/Idh/MocA family oxidoreductase [Caldilinea sp. CFX5]|nr:gfo/Idh/MocA family oxidoreductase [Caldilinea sp. CFX5]
MSSPTQPLKAAIVGLRNHAGTLEPDRNHGLIKSFKAQPDVEIVAYCEWATDQAAALAAMRAADPHARICGSLEELLAEVNFDLAVILLPPNEANPAALTLAAAGKHLFIEKQAGRTAEEVQPLCALAAQTGVVIQVGYPWPYHPVAQEIKTLLAAGVLGKLLAIEARLVTTQVGAGLRDPHHWMYRHDSQGGGILHMEGGHWLTLFHYFTGAQVKSVTALCNRLTDQLEAGVEDVATVALEFVNGVHALLHMGYLLTGVGVRNDLSFILRGQAGAIHWPLTGELTVSSATPAWQSAPVRTFHLEPAARPVYADQWGYDFVAAFLHAIRTGTPPPVSIADGYRILQIIDAAYESSRTGQRVILAE